MPVYEINTDQGTFEIDADREPTQAEALAAIENIPPTPISEQDTFTKSFIEEGTKSNVEQALSNLMAPARAGMNAVGGTLDILRGGVAGLGEMAGTASAQEGVLNKLGKFTGDVLQTGFEVVPRLSYETLNAARQALQNPAETARSLGTIVNPLGTALQSLVSPRAAPTQSEAETAFQNELINRIYQEQGEQGIAAFAQNLIGETPVGEANIGVARAAPLLLGSGGVVPLARAGLGAAEAGLGALGTIPAVEAAGRMTSALTGSIKGGTRMALEKATPKPLIENIVNTLDPRANAINPAKQVQAMKTATASVRRIVNDLTPEDLAHPQTLADNATAKLQAIHAERDALSGVSSTISLDPLADAYLKIANDPVIKTKFPKIVPQLEETAAQYRGKTLSGSDGERFNQVLNAENHTLYEKVPGARAAAEKANPELAAGLEASKALRSQLDNAFGNEFGELGKDYGAWKEVADLAQRQAVKQAKIENRLSLYEGLSGLQAIATSGSPFKTIATLAGGQILKFAGSPLARFEGAARRLSEAIDKGQVPQRPPALPQRPPPLPPTDPTPAVPVAPTPPAAPTVADLISASLKRSDPQLARILAEQGQLLSPKTPTAPVQFLQAPTTSLPATPLNPLQKAIQEAAFPTRPTQGRPTILSSPFGEFTPQQLRARMDQLISEGRIPEAQAISEYLKGQL